MRIKKLDNIAVIITAFLICSFSILETYSFGRFVFIGLASIVLFLKMPKIKGIRLEWYYFFNIIFIIFVFFSSIWAINFVDSLNRGITLATGFGCMIIIYIAYSYDRSTFYMFQSIKLAGIILSLYMFYYYGFTRIMISLTNPSLGRINNDFSNANRIGMLIAYSALVIIYYQIGRKVSAFDMCILVLEVVAVAATQSRKAMLIIAIGALCTLISNSLESKNIKIFLFRIVISIFIIYIVLYLFENLEIFNGINGRLEMLKASITGEGKKGESAILRERMIELGIESFKEKPFIGIGIDNPHILNAQYNGFDAYLHNNYVEILCGGGLLGLTIYYSRYIYLILNLFFYRLRKTKETNLIIIFLFISLIMDYGFVSYFSKTVYYYTAILFTEIRILSENESKVIEDVLNKNCLTNKRRSLVLRSTNNI